MKEIAKGILYWEEEISEHERIVKMIEESTNDWSTYFNYSKTPIGLSKEYFGSSQDDEIINTLYNIEKLYSLEYLRYFKKDFKKYVTRERGSAYFNILKMGPGYQIDSHSDYYVDGNNQKRTPAFTIIIYLNDQYEGAKIEFSDFNLSFKPNSGSVIIFPSSYNHSVNPKLIKGERTFSQSFIYDKDEYEL